MQVQCDLAQSKNITGFSELLTKLVLEISTLLNLCQKIVISQTVDSQALQKSLDQLDNKLKKGLFWKAAAKEEPFHTDHNSSNSNILRRFACRIMEVLTLFKQRADSEPLQIFIHLCKLIAKLQNSVYILQQSTHIQPFAIQTCQALSAFMIPFTYKVSKKLSLQQPTNLNPNTTDVKSFSSSNRDQQQKTSSTEPEYHRKFKRLLGGINCRFKTLDCMDLDYSEFRSNYFQAISKDSLYDSYFKRNESISNQISDYSKKYKEQLSGKSTKRRYKNDLSFKKIERVQQQNFYKEKQKNLSPLFNVKGGVKINNWAKQKQRIISLPTKKHSLVDEVSLTSPVVMIGQTENKQKIFRKTKYEIKNVIITASKIKLEPCQSTRKQSMKTTLKHFEISRRITLRDGNSLFRNFKQVNLSLNK